MSADVIIVGGGIVGVSTAYHLAACGRGVLLLERGRIGDPPPRSSSSDVAKIFRSAYGEDRHMTRLCRASRAWWRTFEQLSGTPLFCPQPMLVGGATDPLLVERWSDRQAASWAAQSFGVLESEGIDASLVTAADVPALFPGVVCPPKCDVALIDRSAGLIRAATAVVEISRLAQAAGAEIVEQAPVAGLVSSDGAVHGVVVGDRPVLAPRIVLAAGAWNLDLWPSLRAHVVVTRQQIVHLGPADQRHQLPNMPTVVDLDRRRYVYRTPDGGALAIADDDAQGGSRLVGAGEIPDGVDGEFWDEAERFAGSVVTGAPPLERQAGKSCRYTSVPNQRYVLLRERGAVVVSACSGHGFKNGPSIGLAAAHLAMGADLQSLSPAFATSLAAVGD